MEAEETTEKTEIVKTKIQKIKMEGKIMILTTRTIKQMDANDFICRCRDGLSKKAKIRGYNTQ